MQYKLENFEIRTIKNAYEEVCRFRCRGFVAPNRNDVPPIVFKIPFAWNDDPYQDRNWMFQLHAWRMLDPHFNQTFEAPKGTAIETFNFIIGVMSDWLSGNCYDNQGAYTWYDMSVGLRALKLASLAVLVQNYDYVIKRPCEIETLVDLHIDELLDLSKLSSGNHGLFQLHGLMSLAYLYPDRPKSEAAKKFALQQMVELINSQLGQFGVHTEASPEYHFFALKKIKNILSSPWWAVIESLELKEKINKAEIASYWLTDPSGRCLPVGDSSSRKVIKPASRMLDWPHYRVKNIVGAIVDGYAIIRSEPSLKETESSLLFLTASFYSQTHKHSDCLSFIWQENGINILIDSGKYGYQKDESRSYFMSSRAHNCVEINNCNDSYKSRNVYGSGIEGVRSIGKNWVLSGAVNKGCDRSKSAKLGRDTFEHRRVILYQPKKFVCVIDELNPLEKKPFWKFFQRNKKNTATAWWHLSPKFYPASEVSAGAVKFDCEEEKVSVHVQYLLDSGACGGKLYKGALKPMLQGWESGSYLQKHPAPVIGFSSTFLGRHFSVTLFELTDINKSTELKLELSKDNGVVSLKNCGAVEGLLDISNEVGFPFFISKILL